MLLEGMVAVVSLCCVMMFATGAPELSRTPNEIYAAGISRFSQVLGIPAITPAHLRSWHSLLFVYDTLDVCTRLGRFIIQELLAMPNWFGRFLGTHSRQACHCSSCYVIPSMLQNLSGASSGAYSEPVINYSPRLRCSASPCGFGKQARAVGMARSRFACGVDVHHEYVGAHFSPKRISTRRTTR